MSKLLTLWTYFKTPKKIKSRDNLLKKQEKSMLKHVKKIRRNSRFFQEHWKDYSDDDWRKFPILDKATMMSI